MPEARRLGLYAELIRVMETGHPYRNDNFFYKDNRFDVVLRIRAFRMPRNCLGVAFEDVTERTRAYEVLHASEKRYRFLFRNTPVMLHSIDATGKIVNVSDHWLSTLGYAREEVIGRKSTAFLTPESRRYAEETVLPAFFASGVCHNIHYQMVKKSGETIDVLLSATAERSPDGAFERSLAVITDVTSLKRAETDARRFARAVEQSLSTVMIVNPEGRIEYVNRDFTALNHLKASDIVGRHFDVLALNAERREEYHRIWQVANERGAWSGTLQMKRPNGDISWGRGVISAIPDESGRVTGYLVTTDDVTAEIRLQQRLAEADKMSAVGLLAAGVAHEFKNYLCGIIGNATFSLDEPNDPAACREMRRTLGTIVDIAERANHLATSLLTYSKAPTHTRQSHDLGAIITQTLALVETELRKSSIEVITHFGETVAVKVTPGEIQQLLLNLLINARQAISSRGVIMISLTRCGNAVLLSVGDTGGGIPTEIQSRIFDPFFSTKGVWGEGEPGGSGLGLSVCRNIAGDHGGELMADSMAGIGTVFTLTLPIDTPGKTGALTPVATVTPRRVILCSRDTGLIRRYLPETAAQNCRLFWMRSSAGKETACNAANLLIWDDDLGADIPSDRQTIEIPIVVVRRRTDRVRPKSAVAVFEDTPPLSTILGAVASSVSVSR
jgi:PAS domain S-box-containing protein